VIILFRNIGATEIIVIAVVLIVLFGGQKLPELARGIAQSIKEFRKAFKEEEKHVKDTKKEDE
jgi:sec-independent protein translocase protein TatA